MDSGWLDILSRLPADLDLNQLARENKAIQRLRGITDAADLLRLGLARGPGGPPRCARCSRTQDQTR